MTKEDAKKLYPIIQAFAEGKTIEYYNPIEHKWETVEDPAFGGNVKDYRIKPQPTYRPFNNAEECWNEMQKHHPFGWVKAIPDKEYKAKYYPNDKNNISLYYHIQKVAPGYIKYDDVNDYCEIGLSDKEFVDVFNTITFADGEPFGVKED